MFGNWYYVLLILLIFQRSDVLLEFQLEHNKHRVGSLVPCVYNFFPVTRRKVAGVPADLDPPQNGPLGPNPLANMDRGVHIR
jgi:hypothetical protein